MLNEKSVRLGKNRSTIREIFEYGKLRKEQIGEENVFDFSIGNPSVPTPDCVTKEMESIIKTSDPVFLHGYTSAQGDKNVRKKIAEYINSRFSTNLSEDDLYMTMGAAASLSATLGGICNAGDEVIVVKPYFPEYKVFVEHTGATLVEVDCIDGTFALDVEKIESAVTEKTKAIIINSPNNPTGVVYSKTQISNLAEVLKRKSEEYSSQIFLIADEPYRELAYDGIEVPFVMNYYDDSIVCYSYSKSLSLPGERIGYIAVNDKMKNNRDVYASICGAGRALGYVCAPNLFQQLVARVQGKTADISIYDRNRKLLLEELTKMGYKCTSPDGAFYLFVKALEDDARAFCERAKEYELLLVPSDDFGVKGYVRISYCVQTEQITRSLPAFQSLIKSYK